MDGPGVVAVFVAALATALATGLGALPFVFVKHLRRSRIGIANALAAGFMVAASGLLFYEGGRESLLRLAVGALLGGLFVAWASRRLAGGRDVHFDELAGGDARKALLLVGVMTVHSSAEGVGVGVAFGGGGELGLVTAIAIAIHNIPEGLAISLLLVPRGVRVSRAAGWSVFSSLPQPLARRSRLPLRRPLRRAGALRARLRGRRDALDGRRPARSRGARAELAPRRRRRARGVDGRDARAPGAASRLTHVAGYPQLARGRARMAAHPGGRRLSGMGLSGRAGVTRG